MLTANADPALPPARCPVCKSAVRMALYADPSTPIYECGSTPTRIVCLVPMRAMIDANVQAPTPAELEWVRDLAVRVVLADGAVSWTPDPRIALGPCGHVTIAGECLAPVDPGLADDWANVHPADGGHPER